MSILRIDRKVNPLSTLKKIEFSYGNQTEALLGTPIVLGTTQPATPTFTYTITSDDFISSPTSGITFSQCLFYVVSGKNNNTATSTVTIGTKINGGEISSLNVSTPAGNYWTLTSRSLISESSLNIGDVITFYLWSTNGASLVNVDYYNFRMGIYRVYFDLGYNPNKIYLLPQFTGELLFQFNYGNPYQNYLSSGIKAEGQSDVWGAVYLPSFSHVVDNVKTGGFTMKPTNMFFEEFYLQSSIPKYGVHATYHPYYNAIRRYDTLFYRVYSPI